MVEKVFISEMGKLEFIVEELLPDDADPTPTDQRSQDHHQGAFTPSRISCKYEDLLRMIDAFEGL